MMVHHDNRTYEEAATEAANNFRKIIRERIEKGKAEGREAMERLRANVPEDFIVPGKTLGFEIVDERLMLRVPTDEGVVLMGVHANAFGQLVESAPTLKVPGPYMRGLVQTGGEYAQLAAKILATHYHDDRKKHLVRQVNDEARGFLSDAYRPKDTRSLVDAFLQAARSADGLPYETNVTETRVIIKAVVPRVYEPVDHEPIAFGLIFEDSEFGASKTRAGVFFERGWCTNKAIISSELAEVHIGSRLSEQNVIWREETIRKDTEATSMAIQDVLSNGLQQEKIDHLCNLIRRAHETEVAPHTVQTFLEKHLGKEKGREATKMFASAERVRLPPGQSMWRFANVLDFFAQESNAGIEERTDLQKLAGDLLKGDTKPKAQKKGR